MSNKYSIMVQGQCGGRLVFSSSIQYLLLFFFSFLALTMNTTGFDFYHHALTQKSWGDVVGLNGVWAFGFVEVPRYMLGGHILYILSLGVIPVAWVVVVVQTVFSVRALYYASCFGGVMCLTVASFLAYNIVFMSMSGLAFVALLTAALSFRVGASWKIWLFLAASFHPLGFASVVILSIFYFSRYSSLLILFVVVFLSVAITCCDVGVYGVRNLIDRFDLYMSAALGRVFLVVLFFSLPLMIVLLKNKYMNVINAMLSVSPVHAYSLMAVLLFGATVVGWESQFVRGSFISYIMHDGYRYPDADKYNLICAAWISRDCYELIDYSDVSFRQKAL